MSVRKGDKLEKLESQRTALLSLLFFAKTKNATTAAGQSSLVDNQLHHFPSCVEFYRLPTGSKRDWSGHEGTGLEEAS